MGVYLASLACLFLGIFSHLNRSPIIAGLLASSPTRRGASIGRAPKAARAQRFATTLCCAGVVLGGASTTPRIAMADEPALVQLPESVLRTLATKTTMPLYPETSKKQGAKGIAVAQVHGNEKGVLTSIEVLEAPDSDIRQAVVEAVKRWQFKSAYVEEKPIAFTGKLTFYFVIDRGKARVENPRKFQTKITSH